MSSSGILSGEHPSFWIALFLGYTAEIVILGATAGCVAFLALGKLFVPDMTYAELAVSGLRVGAILAGVWAPGVSIVLCFIHGKKLRDRAKELQPESR